MGNLQEELFEREKNEWQRYLDEARDLTGMDVKNEIGLTFEKGKRLAIEISCSTKRINIVPDFCCVGTSPDFKLISLLHEFEHYHQYKKLRFIFTSVYGLFCPYWEQAADKFAYKKLTGLYGQEEAGKKMRSYACEWEDLIVKVYLSQRDYGEKMLFED